MPRNNNFNADTLDAIKEVNLSYLMVAQTLLRENMATGMFRLGLDENVARILLALSPAQVVQIASTGNLLCSFRLNSEARLRALRLDGQVQSPARAAHDRHHLHHVTILLAQQVASEEILGT